MADVARTRRLALLRGINVGGRNKVPMAELRTLASDLGYTDVATYIASGNLLFSAEGPDAAASAALAAAIREHVGFAVDVVVVPAGLVRQAAQRHPYGDGDPKRIHVGFCSVPVTDGVLATLRGLATASERVDADGSLLWLDFADGVHASKLAAKLTTALKPGFTTARNLATVRTLASLLDV